MNYIAEIRAFYDLVESNTAISTSCISLWHGLMYQANKAGWKPEFSVAISTLELRTGLKRGAIYTARNTLKQCGVIGFKERNGNQSAMYSINSLCLFNEHKPVHNPEHNPVHNCTDDGLCPSNEHNPEHKPVHNPEHKPVHNPEHNPVPLLNKTKQNETKQKELKDCSLTSHGEAPRGDITQTPYKAVVDLYNGVCVSMPKVSSLTNARKSTIKSRYHDFKGDLSKFKVLFQRAESSDFLTGRLTDRTGRTFTASFDWILAPKNYPKVIEGNYDNRSQGSTYGGHDGGDRDGDSL